MMSSLLHVLFLLPFYVMPFLIFGIITRRLLRLRYLNKMMKVCVYEDLGDQRVAQMTKTFKRWRNFLNYTPAWNYARRINEQVMGSEGVTFAKKQALYKEFYRLGVSGIQGPRENVRRRAEEGVFIYGERP